MEISNTSINASSIVNILTLRYDTNIIPNLPKKSWKDFVEDTNFSKIEIIENLILKNIEETLEKSNTKKLCIALSGGVDSTLILASIRKLFPNLDIEAISIKFADSVDETSNAAKIAERFEANHHVLELENYLSELPNAISKVQLPFWDLHWYYVTKKASSLSNILASGDGGDEIFSGYTFRYEKFLSITDDKSTPLEKVKAYLECHERDRVNDQELIFGKKINFSWDSVYKQLLPYFDNSLSRLQQVFLADYNGKLLYNFNPINTRIAKSFDMKILSPLLSPELITYGLKIPTKSKYDESENIGKLHLRSLIKNYNATSLITKEKLGFNVNSTNLWNNFGQKICKEFLNESRIIQDGWINDQWINKYIDNPSLPIKYINKFLGLLAFEIWYRIFITKDMNSNEKL